MSFEDNMVFTPIDADPVDVALTDDVEEESEEDYWKDVEVGDTVKLLSGGPRMTILKIYESQGDDDESPGEGIKVVDAAYFDVNGDGHWTGPEYMYTVPLAALSYDFDEDE